MGHFHVQIKIGIFLPHCQCTACSSLVKYHLIQKMSLKHISSFHLYRISTQPFHMLYRALNYRYKVTPNRQRSQRNCLCAVRYLWQVRHILSCTICLFQKSAMAQYPFNYGNTSNIGTAVHLMLKEFQSSRSWNFLLFFPVNPCPRAIFMIFVRRVCSYSFIRKWEPRVTQTYRILFSHVDVRVCILLNFWAGDGINRSACVNDI